MKVFVFWGYPPLSYQKHQNFLKLIPDMFNTCKVIQTGILAICNYVSLVVRWVLFHLWGFRDCGMLGWVGIWGWVLICMVLDVVNISGVNFKKF